MKNFFIILAMKMLHFILKICGKNGGNLLGKFAFDWNPDIFKYFKVDCPVIAVTSTNGKTMINNAIGAVFKNSGKKVISNFEGNNMETGILSTILKHCTLTGKIKADFLVFEVDEGYVPIVFKDFKLDTLVVGNFFRDQLDRNGEVESLILKIYNFLKNYNGNLILNNDDPNVARLGKANPNNDNVFYFSVEKYANATTEMKEAGEGKFCPFCKTRLEYEYYQYSHIGEFHCTNCDFKTPAMDVCGTVKDIEKREFIYEQNVFHAPQGGLYTMYNCMAVLCVAKKFAIPLKFAEQAFTTIVVPDGRNEKMEYKGHDLILNLVKNPTGANEVMKVIEEDHRKKTILIVLNDHAQDGRDVSWIYDTFFEKLLNDETSKIITSGTRAYDMALRLKYAGWEKDLTVIENLEDAVNDLLRCDMTMYAIATYTALQPTRKLLRRES